MVLDHHGQALLVGVKRGALRNRPGFQRSLDFEAKIVVQVRSVMPLDAKLQDRWLGLRALARCRLRGIGKMAFLSVFLERHGGNKNRDECLSYIGNSGGSGDGSHRVEGTSYVRARLVP